MSSDTVQVSLILITLVVAGFAIYRSYQQKEVITVGSLVEHVKDAQPIALDVMEVVQIVVNSVEQLKREGKINSNDEAFNKALNLAKKWIPDSWEVSNEDIITAINAAVLVASATSRQAGKSSENDTLQRLSQ